uniref:Uncharacterized protein n=1 Tax=Caenorhabditis japonica TaxID=281687 RepID=A0A8R1IM40_CAEJA
MAALNVTHKAPKNRNLGKVTFDDFRCYPLRTDEEMRIDSISGDKGYATSGLPVIYRYINPTSVCVDPFHVKDMGLALLTSALIGWNESGVETEFNVFALGLYHALNFLGRKSEYPANLKNLLNSLYQLHVKLWKDTVTVKFHVFYKHAQDHQEEYGHLYTTEDFEKQHKLFMTSINHQTTNCESFLVLRKRIHFSSQYGTFIAACEFYWKSRDTSISCFNFVDPSDNSSQFGIIQLILMHNQEIYMVVKQFKLEPMQKSLKGYNTMPANTLSKKIVDICANFPTTFGKVTSSFTSLISIRYFLCPAILIEFNGSVYVNC